MPGFRTLSPTLSQRLSRLQVLRALGPPLVVLLGGVVVAWGITREPFFLACLLALLLLLLVSLYWRGRLSRIYLATLWFALVGYAFLDKGFAYIGFPPVFIGELILFFGVLTLLLTGSWKSLRRSALIWIWLAFAIWSALQTIPYLSQYGIFALRDAALWGYGIFALIVAACLLRTGLLGRIPSLYGLILPWLVLWIPIIVVAQRALRPFFPQMPGTGASLLHVKNGDFLVHLAGLGTFLLLGLFSGTRGMKQRRQLLEWLIWIAWIIGFAVTAIQTRGGMLAVMCAMGLVLALRPERSWIKLAIAIIFLGSPAMIGNLTIPASFSERDISVAQFAENTISIFRDKVEGDTSLSGTREWRLTWWEKIRDYTFFGEYFWTGKGYGINLVLSDLRPNKETSNLRSPHNAHMTILARSGVPGFFLWILLHLIFVFGLLKSYFRARSLGMDWWARFDLWILAYSVAFLINGTFDVYLEGPQGGIWFWSVFGIGIAAIEIQRSEEQLRLRLDAVQSLNAPRVDRLITTIRHS